MGWMFAVNNEGREVGYGVAAECDFPDCHTKIDRGLAYVCGGMHDGGEYGCGKYFCYEHLYGQGLCAGCKDNNDCIDCDATGWIDDEEECGLCEGTGSRLLDE